MMLQPVGKLTPVKARQEEFRQTPAKPVGKLTLISPPDPEVVVEETFPPTESAPDARQLQDFEDSLAREEEYMNSLSARTETGFNFKEASLKLREAKQASLSRDREELERLSLEVLSTIGVDIGDLSRFVIDASNPLESLFEEIAEEEGSGDYVTDVPTAHFGVTKKAADAVGMEFKEGMSKEDSKRVAIAYLEHLDSEFADKIPTWRDLPRELKEAALNTAYNVGPQIFEWKGFMGGLETSSKEIAAINLLDTASSEKKSLRGLAIRRAKQYNKIMGAKIIDSVEQLSDGTLIYRSGDKEVDRYRPKGGRHEDSLVGTIVV